MPVSLLEGFQFGRWFVVRSTRGDGRSLLDDASSRRLSPEHCSRGPVVVWCPTMHHGTRLHRQRLHRTRAGQVIGYDRSANHNQALFTGQSQAQSGRVQLEFLADVSIHYSKPTYTCPRGHGGHEAFAGTTSNALPQRLCLRLR